jgi:hypothetical protein
LLVILISSSLLIIPQAAQAAATLYLSPSSGAFAVGANFTIGVKVNSGGDVINAAEGTITYDTNLLDVVGVSKGGSIFPFWTTEPGASGGSIHFGGGLPPPAYNGTAGHLISVTFRAKAVGTARVAFSSGAVLANDGKGTNILGSMGSANYTLSPTVAPPTKPKQPVKPAEPEYNKPVITSPTHPDQEKWYAKRDIRFEWELPDRVSGVSIGFDDQGVADPGPASDGQFDSKEYTVEEDGVYYLHLKFKDARRWGTIAHFRVQIDTEPPLPFDIEVIEAEIGEWPELHFGTTDEGSGLAGYEVLIGSLDHQAHDVPPEEEKFKVFDLHAGDHTALIKAVDQAGNERVGTVQFNIPPFETPIIEHYPNELKSTDRFFIKGTAVPESGINVYIEKDNIISTSTTGVDKNGSWFYVHETGLDNGRYTFWVEAVNKNGIRSLPTEKNTFLVSPPVFVIVGNFVINYFTVIVSLLFMIILIILLILWLIALIRRRLKKETYDIEEVLHKNALEMKKTIDSEFTTMSKAASKTGIVKAKDNLKAKVDENEKKTLKEIKDVEKMLK